MLVEEAMATHSSVLAWRIPGTGEPGGLPSMGSHRVGHDWSNLTAGAAVVKNLPTNAGDMRDTDLVLGLGRSPGGGHGNPFQYSCLENPGGQSSLEGYTVHKVSKSQTQLKWCRNSSSSNFITIDWIIHPFSWHLSYLSYTIFCAYVGASLCLLPLSCLLLLGRYNTVWFLMHSWLFRVCFNFQ